jgi:hypothetical protein
MLTAAERSAAAAAVAVWALNLWTLTAALGASLSTSV